MAKIPDLGKLAGKLDLQTLMNNVKSLINPDTKIPEPPAGDPIAAKLAEISVLTHQISEAHHQLRSTIEKLNTKISLLYRDLQEANVIKPDQQSDQEHK